MADPDGLAEHAGISEADLAALLGLTRGTELTELHVRIGGASVTVRRAASPDGLVYEDDEEPPASTAERAAGSDGRVAVTAPLVGIFRASIQDGATIAIGQQIGAIE